MKLHLINCSRPRSTVFEEHVSLEGLFHKSPSMADSAPSEIYGKEEHTMFLQMSLCFMTYCTAIKHFLAGQSAHQTLLPCISFDSPKVVFTNLSSLASAETRNPSALEGGAVLLQYTTGSS